MKLYLELLMWLIIPIFVFFILKIWFRITKRTALKKYKPENNKSKPKDEKTKNGGEQFPVAERREQEIKVSSEPIVRQRKHEGRKLFQTTTTSDIRKNSDSTGKNSKGIGRLLRRRRRRRR